MSLPRMRSGKDLPIGVGMGQLGEVVGLVDEVDGVDYLGSGGGGDLPAAGFGVADC